MEGKEKKCQRCGHEFTCRADNIRVCACAKITLDQGTKDYLTKTNYDCLCNTCLKDLNTIVKDSKLAKHTQLIEHTHYYLENGLMVFTELYHINRGHCCKSNCRHCAYGFRFKPVGK